MEYTDQVVIGKMVVIWFVTCVLSIAAFFLMNLIILHGYLIWNKETTYNFLISRKEEKGRRV